MPRPSAEDRARAYVQRSAPRAIEGSRGDAATYAVACALVIEFALSDDAAWPLLLEYNTTKCTPPWTEKDLAAKLRSARNMAKSKPGEVGKLLDVDRADYRGPTAPAAPARGSPANTPTPKTTGPPLMRTPAPTRTVRTPLFTVHKAGAGAKPRTVQTLRTFISNISRITEKKETLPLKIVGEKQPSEESGPATKPEPEEELQQLTVAEIALKAAQEADTAVTVWTKDTGRTVKVHPDGRRVLFSIDDQPKP